MIPLSLPEAIVAWFLRTFLKPVLSPPLPGARSSAAGSTPRRSLNLPPRASGAPDHARRRPDGRAAPGGVALDGAPDRPVVLYLHGGAFVLGGPAPTSRSPASWRSRSAARSTWSTTGSRPSTRTPPAGTTPSPPTSRSSTSASTRAASSSPATPRAAS